MNARWAVRVRAHRPPGIAVSGTASRTFSVPFADVIDPLDTHLHGRHIELRSLNHVA